MRSRRVFRWSWKAPRRVLPQMKVKPRTAKVSGFPIPRRCRFAAATRLNSSMRAFSGCSDSAKVADVVFQEAHQPVLADRVEERPDVGVQDVVHFGADDPHAESIRRIVRATPGPEPAAEAEEILLVDRVQHLDYGALDDLVLDGRDRRRPLPPVHLRDEPSAGRLGAVRPPLDPIVQIPEPGLQVGLVVPSRHPVHAGSRPVHHRLRALTFPRRTRRPVAGREISRFPNEELLVQARVSDHAGPRGGSRKRPRVLPSATVTTSAPGTIALSRPNGWAARSPADASPVPSRARARGSGPMWFATPSSGWTRTISSSPVSRRTTKGGAPPPVPHPEMHIFVWRRVSTGPARAVRDGSNIDPRAIRLNSGRASRPMAVNPRVRAVPSVSR